MTVTFPKPRIFSSLIRPVLILAALFFFLTAAGAGDLEYLMRFPDVHGDTVVFVCGEDIWTAPASGGVASRITIHDGAEQYPKFSPDGSLIAFTGEYDGNADVYVMNRYGGHIRRVTFHPGFDQVVGWHAGKNKILFSSSRDSHGRFTRLYLISPDGTGLERLILNEASQGSFSPDGKRIAYNKVSREERTWKRYRGGLAQDIYLYDLEQDTEKRLTTFEGTDRIPMWCGESIYFTSDRNRVLNIYSLDPVTGATEQLTSHTEYDVRRPSLGDGRIVYELGGDIWALDLATKSAARIPIEIRTDAPEVRPAFQEVSGLITDIDVSPGGERALITARGEIFTLPKESGPTRNLSQDSGSREKDAVWSPDGKSVAWFSDRNGEYDIWISDAKGDKPPVRLTQFTDGYRHTLRWSPDGRKIAFADQTLSLYVIDVAAKKITKVDKALYENVDISLDVKDIYDFAWSPDSRAIAYSKMDEDLVTKVYIADLATGKIHRVSEGLFNDFHPVFSKDGKRLFFVSLRHFDPTFCDFEWEMVYKKASRLFSVALTKDAGSFFPFESDEPEVKEEAPAKEEGKKKKSPPKAGSEAAIDFEGIAERIEAFPLPSGNYRNLQVSESALFYYNAEEGDFNRFEYRVPGSQPLHAFDFESKKDRLILEGVEDYRLSADGKHIVYKKRGKVGIVSAAAANSEGKTLDLSDLRIRLDPQDEWKQIFNEAWRMERDFYYEPGMHGQDWEAMKRKYAPLIERATCRQDVVFVIGELIGELNTSHTYVYGGDRSRTADRVNIGMLGADWTADVSAGRYRFGKILKVPDWTRNVMPPLVKPGVDVKEGEYLLRVNGQEVTTDRNVYSYFQNLAGEQVTLLVNGAPEVVGAREVVVRPLGAENTLRYLDWVEHNRRVVDEASGGKIGYIHLPDTYLSSAREFPKTFYAQTRKRGIIVDGRFNGGGLDPDIFLQRLDKKTLAYWTRRYSHDQTTPAVVTRAHLVCLTNRQAGSGGDMLPMEFKMKKMGPVIGTRSWGGLVGVSMFIALIDGGGLTAPDYRIYDPSGKWIVENEGVMPDIEVDLHPAEVERGYDAQLMKGVEVLMEMIKKDPRPWPEHEKFPADR
ncbi:MAG: PD40 domain-containing protein [Candidatus Aminicenantes bacterium]|nr:PD40 domain-containing protein [Candidatus Aminicenantes bacterium]